MIPRRFIDRDDAKSLINSTGDFRLRHHRNFVLWISYAFIASVLLILLLLKYVLGTVLELTEAQSTPLAEIILTVLFIFLVMLALELYVYIVVKKLHTIALANEFQNMMFSSAMKVHTLFSLIANKERTVVYSDNRSVDIFTADKIATLDELLNQDGLKKDNKETLLKAIENGESTEVPFVYKDSKGKNRDAMIVLDPLERPAGYFIIRGY